MNGNSLPARRRQLGLTLVELMITAAIIAIIAVVAWNQYTQQTIKNRRTDAIRALQAAQIAMERYRSDNGSYDDGAGGANVLANYMQNAPGSAASSNADDCVRNRGYMAGTGGGFVSCRGYYTITVTNLTASTYTLNAVPSGTFTGTEQEDTRCGTLSLTHTGTKTVSLSTNQSRIRECWSQ